jgi:hypothetical protein
MSASNLQVVLFLSVLIGGAIAPSAQPGQSPDAEKPVSKSMATSRTPWGDPDLQGTWDAATLTPLERPASAAGKLVLTRDEAGAIARAEQARNEADARPSDPNRKAPAAGGGVGGYNLAFFDRGSSATMVDGQYRSSIIVDPPDGAIPPMTAAGKARDAALGGPLRRPEVVERARGAAREEPEENFASAQARPLSERCLLGFGWTSGTPMLPNYFYNNGKQIVQTPDSILIFAEMIHEERIVRMNSQHLPPAVRAWTGDSIGHWEGDVLVIETTNFTDKTRFYGSSENLKVTERLRRVGDDAITYRFTVEDPSTWERPWTGEYTWTKNEEPLYEYACHEGNYALVDVLKGGRAHEKDAAAKSDPEVKR